MGSERPERIWDIPASRRLRGLDGMTISDRIELRTPVTRAEAEKLAGGESKKSRSRDSNR
ncbi:MAG: hypothetical protein JWP89_4762 [Schlesneria sp.]|nr:hypothetical protein [Schlesneria sp.]